MAHWRCRRPPYTVQSPRPTPLRFRRRRRAPDRLGPHGDARARPRANARPAPTGLLPRSSPRAAWPPWGGAGRRARPRARRRRPDGRRRRRPRRHRPRPAASGPAGRSATALRRSRRRRRRRSPRSSRCQRAAGLADPHHGRRSGGAVTPAAPARPHEHACRRRSPRGVTAARAMLTIAISVRPGRLHRRGPSSGRRIGAAVPVSSAVRRHTRHRPDRPGTSRRTGDSPDSVGPTQPRWR